MPETSPAGEKDEGQKRIAASAERLQRLKERLLDTAILGLPIALINLVHTKIIGDLTSAPWHILWFIAPLAVAAWVLWSQLRRQGTIRVRGAMLPFLVCYLSVFTLASGSDLLVWRRQTVALDEAALPRNWLAPAGWGDWRYRFVRHPPEIDSPLVVVTMEKPGPDATRNAVRFELARLIRIASASGAKGVAFDFYFGREPSDVDAFLCRVVADAGITVMAGERVSQGRHGDLRAESYPDSISPCFPPDHRGHLIAFRDADGVIRQVALRLADASSTSLSAQVASQLGWDRARLKGEVFQFVEPARGIRPVSYEDFRDYGKDELTRKLRGRFILVGERSQAETFQTPFGKRLGVEVHAAAIWSLVTGSWIVRPPWWSSLLIVVVACYLMAMLAAEGASSRKLLLVTVATSAFVVVASVVAIRLLLVWLDVIYPLVAVWVFLGLLLTLRRKLGIRPPAHPAASAQPPSSTASAA